MINLKNIFCCNSNLSQVPAWENMFYCLNCNNRLYNGQTYWQVYNKNYFFLIKNDSLIFYCDVGKISKKEQLIANLPNEIAINKALYLTNNPQNLIFL